MKTSNTGYFEPFHEIADGIREKLQDGRIRDLPEVELGKLFIQAKGIIDVLDSICDEGIKLTIAVQALGQAIIDESNRRDKTQ